MINIFIESHPGEGGLKSLCHIVNALEKCDDTYKIFVMDDERTLYNTQMFEFVAINKLNKENFEIAMKSDSKIILILDMVIDGSVFNDLEINASNKIYFICKSIK